MSPQWSNKDERNYEHIKDSEKERGASEFRTKEIARRTVKKGRREEGRTSKKTTSGTGKPNRSLEDRSKDELYNRAQEFRIDGRSKMSKSDLVDAIRQRSWMRFKPAAGAFPANIICHSGELILQVWGGHPEKDPDPEFELQVNNEPRTVRSGDPLMLRAGERATMTPGIYHAFWPASEECVMAEVSTQNDDEHDNFFVNPKVGRYPEIEEDEPAEVHLLSEK